MLWVRVLVLASNESDKKQPQVRLDTFPRTALYANRGGAFTAFHTVLQVQMSRPHRFTAFLLLSRSNAKASPIPSSAGAAWFERVVTGNDHKCMNHVSVPTKHLLCAAAAPLQCKSRPDTVISWRGMVRKGSDRKRCCPAPMQKPPVRKRSDRK